MPSADTFSIKPIGNFVKKYLANSKNSVDPFARNNSWCTHTNDINPTTNAQYHLDAGEFLIQLDQIGKIDLAILDPPYSVRQISECYKEIGLPVTKQTTQGGVLLGSARKALLPLLTDDAIVLNFGWNSNGMGKTNGFEIIEVMLVSHGGPHNDTICIAERKIK